MQHQHKQHNNHPKLTLASLAQECATRFEMIENGMSALMDGQAKLMSLATEQTNRPTVDETVAKIDAIVMDAPESPAAEIDKRIVEVAQEASTATINSVMAWLPTATREELKTVRQWLATEALGRRSSTGQPLGRREPQAPAVKTPTKSKQERFQVVRNDGKKCGKKWESFADAQRWLGTWVGNMGGKLSYNVVSV